VNPVPPTVNLVPQGQTVLNEVFKCSAGFYLETEDSGEVSCVTECRIGYSADMETKTCLGILSEYEWWKNVLLRRIKTVARVFDVIKDARTV